MKYEYDYTVFIGRFQPYHIGHHEVVRHALTVSKHLIIVFGSHEKSPDIRNPLSSSERLAIVNKALFKSKEELGLEFTINTHTPDRVSYVFQKDHTYNMDRWIAGIQTAVNSIVTTKQGWTDSPPKIGIIGYSKDHTTFYLKSFPQWDTVDYKPYNKTVNATDIRKSFFDFSKSFTTEKLVNGTVAQVLEFFNKKQNLIREYELISSYKKAWENSPYPVTFHTVDAIVRQSGHILMVKRGAAPGEDQWAFPGGFIGPNETLEEAVIRELKEETKIDIPVPVIKGSIKQSRTFDDPTRSVRGRTITTAFDICLNNDYSLPKVKGSDDATDAKWFTFNEFSNMRNQIFEDHYCIAEALIGI